MGHAEVAKSQFFRKYLADAVIRKLQIQLSLETSRQENFIILKKVISDVFLMIST